MGAVGDEHTEEFTGARDEGVLSGEGRWKDLAGVEDRPKECGGLLVSLRQNAQSRGGRIVDGASLRPRFEPHWWGYAGHVGGDREREVLRDGPVAQVVQDGVGHALG